jgi:hypothetical protein
MDATAQMGRKMIATCEIRRTDGKDDDGFFVSGNECSWCVLWPEALLKGKDKLIFMFCGKGTIFIFGKRYLTVEQQQALRYLTAI